jgi:hypothetical protein
VTEFVENWLVKSFADGKTHPVKVYFPDEVLPRELQDLMRGKNGLEAVAR